MLQLRPSEAKNKFKKQIFKKRKSEDEHEAGLIDGFNALHGYYIFPLKEGWGDFPGDPVVKTSCFQCRGHRFNPWSEN